MPLVRYEKSTEKYRTVWVSTGRVLVFILQTRNLLRIDTKSTLSLQCSVHFPGKTAIVSERIPLYTSSIVLEI